MHTIPTARMVAGAVLGLFSAGLFTNEAGAAVGRTETAYGVTPSGSVSYTIPIRVTEGINGLTPSLAITYAGRSTRTILGVGFALSGISYITPCRKTIAQDVNAAPVTLTSADRYCLDGARLRLVSGTPYGAPDSTYRTELDQLVRVTAKSSTSNIPGWFKVEMPNGLEYEYGNSTDSKLLASSTSGAPPQFWAVSKISDPAGNSISFVYDKSDTLRRFRPDYIDYTASNGGPAKYRIDFVYPTAPEAEPTLKYTPSNIGGAAISDDKLLERIDLLHEGSVYRQYLFTYQAGAGNNRRLSSIEECVPGTTDPCFPATQLTWQDATEGYTSPVTTSAAAGSIPLDVNGDGIEDLVWSASGTWRYVLGSASGYGSVINTGVVATNPSKALPLEWNGDSFWDLLVDWSDGKWRVLKGSSSGFLTSVVAAGPSPGIPSGSGSYTWTVADVNSDGRDDLLKMALNAALSIRVRINTATGFGTEQVYYTQTLTHTLSKGFVPMNGGSLIRRPDFNGDGRTDLLIYACEWEPEPPGFCYLSTWRVLVSNGTSFAEVGFLLYSTFSIDPRYADFNADGLTDVVYPAQTPGKWYIGLGQGSGNLSFVAGPSFTNYENYKILTGDHDGDGYDDLYASTLTSLTWDVFHGSPSGFASAESTGISSVGSWAVANQTGDDLPDLGRSDSTSSLWSTYAHLGLPGDRLLTCTDGLGNKVIFTYLPMTSSTVYTKGTGALYPLRDYKSATPLVWTMQIEPAGPVRFFVCEAYHDDEQESVCRTNASSPMARRASLS